MKVVSAAEARDICNSTGAEELPTQWIEVDRNEYLRSESGQHVEPKMKSRLVARGDLSNLFGRADSPTADKEVMFIILSWAASRNLRVRGADLDHGYFHGE